MRSQDRNHIATSLYNIVVGSCEYGHTELEHFIEIIRINKHIRVKVYGTAAQNYLLTQLCPSHHSIR